MTAILALTAQTWKCAWRRPSLPLLAIAALGLAPICAAWSGAAFWRWHSGLVAPCLALIALILGAESMAGEKLEGSAVLFLVAPVAPWRSLAGKWLGIAAVNAALAAGCLALSLGISPETASEASRSFFLAWLRSCHPAAASLSAGTIMGPVGAATVALFLEAGGYLVGLIRRLGGLAGIPSPWRLFLRIFPDYPLYEASADFLMSAALADAAPRCMILIALGALFLARRPLEGGGL